MNDRFDDAWENWVEAVLGETDFDTELGKELSKDAQRLSKGEITEEEFHEKHHEAIVEEFGVDDRPVEPSNTDN